MKGPEVADTVKNFGKTFQDADRILPAKLKMTARSSAASVAASFAEKKRPCQERRDFLADFMQKRNKRSVTF